ncbi:MAG: chemotaxis protein CheB [Phycisphaerales bacterium]
MTTHPNRLDRSGIERSGVRPTVVVGIACSAGGLRALEAFLDRLPTRSGAAIVVIQHLSPDYESMLGRILDARTPLDVRTAVDDERLEPDTIRVIPPGSMITVSEGRLSLRPVKESIGERLPADVFFASLAEDAGDRAVAIVLSGAGSDGRHGAVAIKQAGGLVLVQDPSEAQFDGMPRSVIDTGIADAIVPVHELPEHLIACMERRDSARDRVAGEISSDSEFLRDVLHVLRDRIGRDFRAYKPATVGRRVARRMMLRRVEAPAAYLGQLREDPDEATRLARDLLIGVTWFFRDDAMWSALHSALATTVGQAQRAGTTVEDLRLWSAGCSSGQESYSLAIAADEALREVGSSASFRVFATDIDASAVAVAGRAVYDASIEEHVSAERLKRYFERTGENWTVRSHLRQRVITATHDLLTDPPFLRLDVASCRNVLIYLDSQAQQQVLSALHFALRPDGLLLLGPGETTSLPGDAFQPVPGMPGVYRRGNVAVPRRTLSPEINVSGTADWAARAPGVPEGAGSPESELDDASILAELPGTRGADDGPHEPGRSASPVRRADGSLPTPFRRTSRRHDVDSHHPSRELRTMQAVTESVAPPSLLVSRRGKLIRSFGTASELLRVPVGSFSDDVAAMLPGPAGSSVAAGVRRCLRSMEPTSVGVLEVRRDPGVEARRVRFRINPIDLGSHEEPLALVVLEPAAPLVADPSSSDVDAAAAANTLDVTSQVAIERLEGELRSVQDELQFTIEDLEAANEELQSTNEEMLASNEELQAANEELHSVNEELHTVNAEHAEKIRQLTAMTDDFDNLLRATAVGTVFLDPDMTIRRFTPAAARYLPLRDADIGRPITELTSPLASDELLSGARRCLEEGEAVEIEAKHGKTGWVLVRIMPFLGRTGDRRGAVLTIIDIGAIRAREAELKRLRDRLDHAVDGSADGLWEWGDIRRDSMWWSPRFRELLELDQHASAGFEAWASRMHPTDEDRLRSQIDRHLEGRVAAVDLEVRLRRSEGRFGWYRIRGVARGVDGELGLRMAGSIQDVDERHRALQNAEMYVRLSQEIEKTTGIGGWDLDFQTNTLQWSDATRRIHEVSDDFEPDIENAVAFYDADSREHIAELIEAARASGHGWDATATIITTTGKRRLVRTLGRVRFDDGRAIGVNGTIQIVDGDAVSDASDA